MDNNIIYNTNNFKIQNNTISFNNSLIQISSISHLEIKPVPKPDFRFSSIIVIIIGIVLMVQEYDIIRLLGFLFVIFAAIYILYYVLKYCGNEDKYLCIYLNSGYEYYIYCENKKFLKKVVNAMKDCINNKQSIIKVDFNQCILDHVPINIGNQKEVVNTITEGNDSDAITNIDEREEINSTVIGNPAEASCFSEDWELIRDELRKACETLPKSSLEYIAAKEALRYADCEDEDALIQVFNQYHENFLSSLFKSVVSGVLVEIIKSVLL